MSYSVCTLQPNHTVSIRVYKQDTWLLTCTLFTNVSRRTSIIVMTTMTTKRSIVLRKCAASRKCNNLRFLTVLYIEPTSTVPFCFQQRSPTRRCGRQVFHNTLYYIVLCCRALPRWRLQCAGKILALTLQDGQRIRVLYRRTTIANNGYPAPLVPFKQGFEGRRISCEICRYKAGHRRKPLLIP